MTNSRLSTLLLVAWNIRTKGKDRNMTKTGLRLNRIYKCSNGNCGMAFKKNLVSLVTPCVRCRAVAYDREFNPEKENLDWYSAKKERWYKYPQLHEEHIKMRKLEGKNKRYVVRDKKGLIIEREEQIPV